MDWSSFGFGVLTIIIAFVIFFIGFDCGCSTDEYNK